MNATPFVKWVGGKRRLLTDILHRLPLKIDYYYEPFVGGGAAFFALASEGRITQAHLNDKNEELINAYRVVRDEVEQLIPLLSDAAERHSKDFYYAVRAEAPTSDLTRAARLIYLNKTCFNGVYRVNSDGQFNVPMGAYTTPDVCNPDVLRRASAALKCATLTSIDFFEAVSNVNKNTIVYFDSPYFPLTKTADFTSYTKEGFSLQDHERLARIMKVMAEEGVPALLSNSYNEWTLEAYKHPSLVIDLVQVGRSINSDVFKRQKVNEILVSTTRLLEMSARGTEAVQNTSL